MTFNISEYSQGLPFPNYKKTDYSLELEMAVLSKKTQEQQKALQSISAAQNTALNIAMLNLEGRDRLDSYNREIAESLSKDLGDLTKVESQNKIANLFQKIAGDTQLIDASKKSKEHISEYERIQREKMSGKKESGYNTINEFVYMNEEGGYYDFMKQSLNAVTDPNYRLAKYTPYKDLKTPIANLTKLLHEDIYQTETQGITGTPEEIAAGKGRLSGYLTKNIYGGVSPERVQALYKAQLGPDGMAQLEVLAKYDILKAKQSGLMDVIHSKYDAYHQNTLSTFKDRENELNQKIIFNNSLIKKAGTPAEKINQLQLENQEYAKALTTVKANVSMLEKSYKTKDDFTKMSTREAAMYYYPVIENNNMIEASNALSWKKQMQSLSPDIPYLQALKMNFQAQQNQIERENKLTIAAMRRTGKKGDGSDGSDGTSTPDSVWSSTDLGKNQTELLSSYERMTTLQKEYATSTGDIITTNGGKTFSHDKLKPEAFRTTFKEMGNNYQIKMWDKFAAANKDIAYDSNGNPQIGAFGDWLAEQEKNPSTQEIAAIIDKQKTDKYIADFVTQKLEKINKTMRGSSQSLKALQPYARNEDGSVMSQEDFDSGKPVYVNYPTRPKLPNETDAEYRARGGTYQVKPLKDVYYDIDTNESGEYITNKYGQIEKIYKNKYLFNDNGLLQTITQFKGASQDKTLLSILEKDLKQFEQYSYMQTSDKDEIQKYIGDISTAGSIQGDSSGTIISPSDIEVIAVPSGTGTQGLVRFKDEAAKRLEAAGIKMPTEAGGLELVTVGKRYKFETTALNARNPMFNYAALEVPYTDTYKDFKYTISTDNAGERTVTIQAPNGRYISVQAGNSRGEIEFVIQKAKENIELYTKNDKLRESVFGGSSASPAPNTSGIPDERLIN
jgi:hypothetical protein